MYGNILSGSLQGVGWDFSKERKKIKWDLYASSRKDKSLTHLSFFLLTFFHCALKVGECQFGVLELFFTNDRKWEFFYFLCFQFTVTELSTKHIFLIFVLEKRKILSEKTLSNTQAFVLSIDLLSYFRGSDGSSSSIDFSG